MNAISYNSLINGFSIAHLWEEALHVLEQFQDSSKMFMFFSFTAGTLLNLQPRGCQERSLRKDQISYTATMLACGRAQFWQEAIGIGEIVRFGCYGGIP